MRSLPIAIGLTLIPFYGWAQFGNPAGMAPGTKMEAPGKPAPGQTNYQDWLFVSLAAAGGMAEVDLGALAAGRAASDGVKTFARRMVEDHTEANRKLKEIAEGANVTLPDAVDPDQARMKADLEKLQGAEFDSAYMQGQVTNHQKTVQLLTWQIGSGQNAELQKFAAQTLPTVMAHLEMARMLQARLAGESAVGQVKAK